MAKAVAPVPEEPSADENWQIEVDHAQYYRWVPIKDEDIPPDLPADQLVESTWPGFHLQRIVVDEPTTSTTGVHVLSLRLTNDDLERAGRRRRPDHVNLCQHLEDGPWAKHFPLDSITAIRCSNPAIEAKLVSYFLED